MRHSAKPSHKRIAIGAPQSGQAHESTSPSSHTCETFIAAELREAGELGDWERGATEPFGDPIPGGNPSSDESDPASDMTNHPAGGGVKLTPVYPPLFPEATSPPAGGSRIVTSTSTDSDSTAAVYSAPEIGAVSR